MHHPVKMHLYARTYNWNEANVRKCDVRPCFRDLLSLRHFTILEKSPETSSSLDARPLRLNAQNDGPANSLTSVAAVNERAAPFLSYCRKLMAS